MGGISQGLINGHGVRVRLRGFPDAGKRETQKRAGVGKRNIVGLTRAENARAGSGGGREIDTSLGGETMKFVVEPRARAGGGRGRRGGAGTRPGHISIGGR